MVQSLCRESRITRLVRMNYGWNGKYAEVPGQRHEACTFWVRPNWKEDSKVDVTVQASYRSAH